jgi:ribosome maturation factor RimP
MADVGERLWDTLEPFLEAEGVELDDLDVRGRGNGRLVRVTVDAPGGIGVDRIAEISRAVSRLLDESDPVAGSYTLEVSSPGLERPLRRPSHFEKSVGREVDLKTVDEIDGDRRHRGVLERIDDHTLQVVVDGAERSIPMESVAAAKTVFRWEKSPKPGGKRGVR